MKILIVENDFCLGDRLFQALRKGSWALDWVSTTDEAESVIREQPVGLLVVDLTREATTNGRLELLARLRGVDRRIPAIAITDDPREVKDLEDCADAVELAPVTNGSLVSAVRRLAGRDAGADDAMIVAGELSIDLRLRQVRQRSDPVSLERKEYSVLRRLAHSPGETVPRAELVDATYHWSEEIGSNALEVHISRLRKKLGKDPIETVRGVGYRLAVDGRRARFS